MKDRPVYSTDSKQATSRGGKQEKIRFERGDGPIKIRLEKKGRGGKLVTVLFNLPMTEGEAKVLMRDLQTRLACGATLKNSCIELRGDVADRVLDLLASKGLSGVRAGA